MLLTCSDVPQTSQVSGGVFTVESLYEITVSLGAVPFAGFVPYAGEGYALLLPSKWNPSKERESGGIQLR